MALGRRWGFQRGLNLGRLMSSLAGSNTTSTSIPISTSSTGH